MKLVLDTTPEVEMIETTETAGGLSLALAPLFRSPNGKANVLYGQIKSDAGVVLNKFALTISGTDGKPVLRVFRATTKAAVDVVKNEVQG